MVVAQDAEGANEQNLGGASLVFALPPAAEVFEAAMSGKAVGPPRARGAAELLAAEAQCSTSETARLEGVCRWRWTDLLAAD